MKAIVVNDYGPTQNARFADVAKPRVKATYLLVRMRAAAINAFDCKILTGAVKSWWPITFPYIPGMDGAGEIVEVGEHVQNWRVGEHVLAHFRNGAFAEYALISANKNELGTGQDASDFGIIARKPDDLDFRLAAAIPESGLTAKSMVRAANLEAGQSALVIGATGGVGLFIVQLAKAKAVRVIATGSAEDESYLRELGADDVVDYRGDDISEVVRRYPNGIDVVFDLINMGDALLRDSDVLREFGTLISSLSGPSQDAFQKTLNVRYVELNARDGDLDDLVRLAAEHKLRVEVEREYALSEAAQALSDFNDLAKHTRGKTVISISQQ